MNVHQNNVYRHDVASRCDHSLAEFSWNFVGVQEVYIGLIALELSYYAYVPTSSIMLHYSSLYHAIM